MLSSLKKLTGLLDPRERRNALVLLGLMMAGALLEAAGVGAIPGFVALLSNPDRVLRFGAVQRAFASVGATTPSKRILWSAAALAIVFVIKNVYFALLTYAQSRYVYHRQVSLAGRLYAAYMGNSYAAHLQRNSADLLHNLNIEVMRVVADLLLPILRIVMEVLVLTAVLCLLIAVEPVVSVSMMILLGLASALFLRTIRRKLTSLGEDEHRFRKLMMRNASQGLGGLKDLKVLGREAYFVRSFVASAWSYTRAGVYRATIFELPRLFLETIAVMTMLGVAALLIYQKRPMQDIVPVLTLLAIAAVRLMPSTNRIVSAIVGIRYGIPALDAIHKDFQSESQELPSDAIEERSGPQFEHAIEFVDVRFRYANSIRDSLRGVSVRIEKGSAVAVIGASGAGKTTLVDVLLGLLKPTSGSVRVDGRDIHENLGHWQRQIGYIPQHVFLADDTIRRNIAFGVADEQIDDERIKTVLESAQLRDFVGTLPAGVDTEIGERGARLSGGQRQRIGIARALYHDPPILVMDEATSALDHKTESLIVEVLEQLRGGRTMIVIAHRHSTVQHFENVLLIEDGRIKAQGKLREVIAAGA